ncbi:hypothetical protein COT75_03975 [Candidatus Beckwithbacteria bacterium CG10_big_fil_rev_8_21_14_0_10_34_10]|uniref:DUF1003 domain-containing protein n=1 Tax=Candidatus Beckwithbacteria bacterium CG10_big_fil_rev_8_21_14_0_10_34_10 TaxID=1974495 RepID=A0A2H0W8K6_9BACT|nr:MAG: hypothetical protein COT75_03975 [Candidatus Beckwithbacteria bacterium CG10_big_fil_rev_8_21_14_0_10_34_10]
MDAPPTPDKIKKNTKTLLEKATGLVSRFLGSWWAVIFHTIWFTIWLILNFDINVLTFSVSLEAIFIGIFLLMSANKSEIQRDKREARQRVNDRKRLETDIKLDEKADRQLTEIKSLQKTLYQDIKSIKYKLNKLTEEQILTSKKK